MLVRGGHVRFPAGHGNGGADEALGGDLVAVFAGIDVNQGAIGVDGPVQAVPASADLEARVAGPRQLRPGPHLRLICIDIFVVE